MCVKHSNQAVPRSGMEWIPPCAAAAAISCERGHSIALYGMLYYCIQEFCTGHKSRIEWNTFESWAYTISDATSPLSEHIFLFPPRERQSNEIGSCFMVVFKSVVKLFHNKIVGVATLSIQSVRKRRLRSGTIIDLHGEGQKPTTCLLLCKFHPTSENGRRRGVKMALHGFDFNGIAGSESKGGLR